MSVTRIRPAGLDDMGDPIGDPVRTSIDVTGWAPSTSTDITDRAREGVVARFTLYGPIGLDLVHTDLVDIGDGHEYQLDGDPGPWVNPLTGWAAGSTVDIWRAAG